MTLSLKQRAEEFFHDMHRRSEKENKERFMKSHQEAYEEGREIGVRAAPDVKALMCFEAGKEEGIRQAAKIARDADHCDLPGHGCTQEIERNILALLPPPKTGKP